MCAWGKLLFWNSMTQTLAITLPRTPSLMSFKKVWSFKLKTRVTNLGRSLAICPGRSAYVIFFHLGLQVNVTKRSYLLNLQTLAMASWYSWPIAHSPPWNDNRRIIFCPTLFPRMSPTFNACWEPLYRSQRNCSNPTLGKCEDETHISKSGNLESSGTPATSELEKRGQNTSPWGVIYTVRKVLKCRCRKWPPMSHLDIYNTSYGRKKGRESNWQFDFWPQKVGNRPDPGGCRRSATWCWKALEENYKITSYLIPIRGLSRELWVPKVPGFQTGTVWGLHFGSPGKKSHLDAGVAE